MRMSFTPHVRPRNPRLVVLGSVLVILLSVAAAVVGGPYVRQLHAKRSADLPPEIARVSRRATALDVAPAPLPTALPLIGPEGRDANGYPLRYVDRPAFRSLLAHHEYAALNRYFDQLQASFEGDPRTELWPMSAADAFDSPEPALRPALDAWVAATPAHFAPYLARGTYLHAVGAAERGPHFIRDTPPEDLAAMAKTFKPARDDLDKALALRPKLVAAMRQQIFIARHGWAADGKRAIDLALKTCPTCFQVRTTYIYSLTPRWGGSYGAMARFAAEAPVKLNGRLHLLPGFLDLDRSSWAVFEGKLDDALVAAEHAVSFGEHWEFLEQRADVHERRGDLEKALADLDRANTARPGMPSVLIARARVHVGLRHGELAGNDLLAALRVRSTGREATRQIDYVVKQLVFDAWVHHLGGRRDDALRLLDLAASLSPGDTSVIQRRAAVVVGASPAAGGTPAPSGAAGGVGSPVVDEIAQLEAAAASAPDDFRAHQTLDYALARRGRFDRVIEMWTTFLSRNPNEARAYFERGGAYHHARRPAEALADFRKACELGLNESCAQARR